MQSKVAIFFFCLEVSSVALTESSEPATPGESDSVVICRHCGHDLFDPQDIFTFASPGSLRTKNSTLIGSVRSHVQLLRNPHGYEFEVVTVRHSICSPEGTVSRRALSRLTSRGIRRTRGSLDTAGRSVYVRAVIRTSDEPATPGESDSVVICRHCGHDLFDPQDIFTFASPGSLRTKNSTLIGSVRSHVQLLRNPHGYEFEVVTVRHSICSPEGTWHSSHSWFPGYSWKICLCPSCHTHIGWMFKKVKPTDEDTANNSFFGLILDKILEESTISQLLITPKAYRV